MAKTIYTYLHNDDLNGSRIITMDDCMCKLYDIKRDDSKFMHDFSENLQKPALYILLNKEKHKAYIGETDDFCKRIAQHLVHKDFWDEVMVFLGSNEDTIGKTEVQLLEYLAYHKALDVKSYDLSENTQSPKQPHMGVMQKAKTENFFNYVQFLSKFIGCDIFERTTTTVVIAKNEEVKPLVTPVPVDFTNEEISGRIKFTLNGEGPYSKREIVLAIVKEFIKRNPKATFAELRATFKRSYLGHYGQYEFLETNIDTAKRWREFGEDQAHFFLDEVLTSSDGVQFIVCNQWYRNNLPTVLGIAKALGWECQIFNKTH